MKRSKAKPRTSRTSFLRSREHFIWGAFALAAWIFVQVRHAQDGTPFSMVVFLKGLLLLFLAAAVYQRSSAKNFSFLGFFPLLWLSVSTFQWDLCASPQHQSWLWLTLFLTAEMLVLWVGDGKKLALLLTPLWGAMAWLFAFSFLLPLTFFDAPRIKSTGMTWIRACLRAVAGLFPLPFLRSFFPVLAGSVLFTAVGFLAWLFPLLWIPLIFLASPGSRFKRSDWVLRAGLGAGLLFFVLFKGWTTFQFQWTGLYDLLVHGRYIAFFLLGWLGLLAFPRQGTARYILFPMFLLVLGFLFWPGHSLADPLEMGILKWALVFFAGFGLESLRRDLMDPTWHGRLVWFALGAAFFGGVV